MRCMGACGVGVGGWVRRQGKCPFAWSSHSFGGVMSRFAKSYMFVCVCAWLGGVGPNLSISY